MDSYTDPDLALIKCLGERNIKDANRLLHEIFGFSQDKVTNPDLTPKEASPLYGIFSVLEKMVASLAVGTRKGSLIQNMQLLKSIFADSKTGQPLASLKIYQVRTIVNLLIYVGDKSDAKTIVKMEAHATLVPIVCKKYMVSKFKHQLIMEMVTLAEDIGIAIIDKDRLTHIKELMALLVEVVENYIDVFSNVLIENLAKLEPWLSGTLTKAKHAEIKRYVVHMSCLITKAQQDWRSSGNLSKIKFYMTYTMSEYRHDKTYYYVASDLYELMVENEYWNALKDVSTEFFRATYSNVKKSNPQAPLYMTVPIICELIGKNLDLFCNDQRNIDKLWSMMTLIDRGGQFVEAKYFSANDIVLILFMHKKKIGQVHLRKLIEYIVLDQVGSCLFTNRQEFVAQTLIPRLSGAGFVSVLATCWLLDAKFTISTIHKAHLQLLPYKVGMEQRFNNSNLIERITALSMQRIGRFYNHNDIHDYLVSALECSFMADFNREFAAMLEPVIIKHSPDTLKRKTMEILENYQEIVKYYEYSLKYDDHLRYSMDTNNEANRDFKVPRIYKAYDAKLFKWLKSRIK